jgi:2-polyprenyl-6-hydroxyphenyl methylase/3-demethylubiquinone-9 3-methyltransferase
VCISQDYISQLCTQHLDVPDATAEEPLNGLSMLDVGCGGGVLAEVTLHSFSSFRWIHFMHDTRHVLLSQALAKLGASVCGVDAGDANIKIAQHHADNHQPESIQSRLTYQAILAEDLLLQQADNDTAVGQYDVVTSLEVIEHVDQPEFLVQTLSRLVRPGGLVFLSTINRNAESLMVAIVGAESVLRWVPPGTHDWAKFVKPSELQAWCDQAGLNNVDLTGMLYNPLRTEMTPSHNTDVNYIMCCVRPVDK